jgi:hypothetical protein
VGLAPSIERLPADVKLKAYGSLGNFCVKKPANYGIPGNDYRFWQLGVVTSVWGSGLHLGLHRYQHRLRGLQQHLLL